MRSNYTILGIKSDVIYIEDMNIGGKSLTNDIEDTIREVVNLLGNKRIIYKDSEGVWCEAIHNNGIFIGFGEDNAFSEWTATS